MPTNNGANKPKPKGFKPKPFKKTPVYVAPAAERDSATPQDKTITLEVSSEPVGDKAKTQEVAQLRIARGIFGRTPPVKAEPSQPLPAAEAIAASKPRTIFAEKPPAANTLRVMPPPEPLAKPEPVAKPEPEEKPAPLETPVAPPEPTGVKKKKRVLKLAPGEAVVQEEEPSGPPDIMNQLKGTDLEQLAKDIRVIQTENPYRVELPEDGYVPETRRGFGPFILQYYKRFMLPLPDKKPDYDACLTMGKKGTGQAEMYQYQEFVREYMRWESPYRGCLVYHGLGSGKTCTAIAASEALFSTGGRKRIIVMTPKSLRKNFIKEITKCGFRHFRLKNHWVSFPVDKLNPMVYTFATQVMKIPESYVKKQARIWVPDFKKEPNFDELSKTDPTAQQEIRNQIEATLVYDPFQKKDGLIWFINYNGIQADQLKTLACDPSPDSPFDNAVIVIDEIHNVVRNIQGSIDPYLLALPNKQRKVPVEPITPFKWTPELCGKDMGYKRAYLMYRLLVGAKNSKIIGLSGTPLINFPEELGILSNILHGYIHYAIGRIAKAASIDKSEAVVKAIDKIGLENPYVDFVKASIDDTGIEFIVTMLPERIKKVQENQGGTLVTKEKVMRIPETEKDLGFKERVDTFLADLAKASITVAPGSVQYKSEAVLPPFFQQFKDAFLTDSMELQNPVILMKRLTGLISYYKGSRKDLMPTVTNDIVVRVPMTPYTQEKYSLIRREEIDQEEKQKKKKAKGEAAGSKADWSLTTDIKKLKLANSYRMGSRQVCNFAFPPGVNRPRPQDETEQRMEIGNDDGGDIIDEVVDEKFGDDDEDTKSILEEDAANTEEAKAQDAEQEQKEFDAFLADLRATRIREGKSEAEIQAEIATIQEARRTEQVAVTVEKPKKTPNALRPPQSARLAGQSLCSVPLPEDEDPKIVARRVQECGAAQYEDEDYAAALLRAKRCLCTLTRDYLKLDGKLNDVSPKYHAMITKMLETNGSSLVYSQFLDMEGIGIFTLALDVNGWTPIKINLMGGKAQFDAATLESLKQGPEKGVNRYIKFTGGEDDIVRKMSVDIFNANFGELPQEIQKPLKDNGFTDNKTGQLCRLFCITSAGAEGLSLKNVRAVHIMESYWNDVRLAQVKGRAVRICSHMDLEPKDRTVDIYTYISVYGPEAQVARTGEMKIDQSIVMKDAIPLSEAKALGVEGLPEGTEYYIATSDDYLYLVSQRKKKLIDNLQKLMKMSAIDCELNILENDDGSYTCKVFKGEPGDFMYHPLLSQELKQSKSKYTAVDLERVARQRVKTIKIRGIPHALKPVFDYETGQVVLYEFFELSDTKFENPVGSVKVDDKGEIIQSTAQLKK